jgi:hypothetical protein
MKPIVQRFTPNKGRERSPAQIDLCVVHFTGSDSLQSTLGWFENDDSDVSAHFVIDRNGDIYSYEQLTTVLWHAGVSMFDGEPGANSRSIGYELVGRPSSKFTDEQYESLFDLLEVHCQQFSIKAIVGHDHIALFRKVDPGIYFDWARLREEMLKRLPKKANGLPTNLQMVANVPIAYKWPKTTWSKEATIQPETTPVKPPEDSSIRKDKTEESAPTPAPTPAPAPEPVMPSGMDPSIGVLLRQLLKAILSHNRKRVKR